MNHLLSTVNLVPAETKHRAFTKLTESKTYLDKSVFLLILMVFRKMASCLYNSLRLLHYMLKMRLFVLIIGT